MVLYIFPKQPLLLPTKCRIRGLVVRQNDTNPHLLVPTSLYYLQTDLYTSVVAFIYVHRLMESPFEAGVGLAYGGAMGTDISGIVVCS